MACSHSEDCDGKATACAVKMPTLDVPPPSEHWYYSRGDTLAVGLVLAIASRDGYARWEVVSQHAVIVVCTPAQWVEILKEAKGLR